MKNRQLTERPYVLPSNKTTYRRFLAAYKNERRKRATCSGGNCQLCYFFGLKCINATSKQEANRK